MAGSAWAWDEKGKATLRSLTCECGEDVLDETEFEVFDGSDDDESVTCSACGREYEAVFLVRIMETDQSEAQQESDDISSATGLILSDAVDSTVRLYYTSSISGNTKEVVGTLTSTDRGLWAEMSAHESDVADEGDDIKVYGDEVSDRGKGEVTKNGRKVGMFEQAEVL